MFLSSYISLLDIMLWTDSSRNFLPLPDKIGQLSGKEKVKYASDELSPSHSQECFAKVLRYQRGIALSAIHFLTPPCLVKSIRTGPPTVSRVLRYHGAYTFCTGQPAGEPFNPGF
jgi:hypothetical protein